MKILHVIESLAKEKGGAAEIVPCMCEELVKNGNEVTLVTLEYGSLTETAEKARIVGVKIIEFKWIRSSLNPISFSFDMLLNLMSLVKEHDMIHIHGMWQFPCWFTAYCARRIGKPYVVMPHGSIEPERLKISFLKKKISGIIFDNKMLNRASAVWVTAESEKDSAIEYGVRSKLEIVPLGLNSENFNGSAKDRSFLETMGVDLSKKILLYFSRITWIKGLDLLADAWAELACFHKEWQLLIVGPDDRGYTKIIKDYYKKKCSPGTYLFHGPIYKEDKYKLLASVDVLVLPTRNENFSIAVAEAMASRLPVICTKGAPWGVINSIDAGRWVDISIEGLVKGIREVLSFNDFTLQRMGENGKEWIDENLDWGVVAQLMIKNYEMKVLKK